MLDAFRDQYALKERIRQGAPVLGVFVKTPCMQTVEVIGTTQLDFVVLDVEHAPFSVDGLNECLLAARAARVPALVRLGNAATEEVTRCLDLGAAGIVFPHVKSKGEALEHIGKTRYLGGKRGFSASHRAAGFGTLDARAYVEQSDKATLAIAQIEDVEAVSAIDDIAAVPELDTLFIGPADLELSLRATGQAAPSLEASIAIICEAGRKANKTIGIFQMTTVSVPEYRQLGVTFFVVSTDQALLRKSAENLSKEFKSLFDQVR